MKRPIAIASMVLLGFAAFVWLRSALLPTKQWQGNPVKEDPGRYAKADAAIRALVAIPTVSYSDAPRSDADFLAFWRAVDSLFPATTSYLEYSTGYSRLYRWPGKGLLKPVLFAAHLDVVPPGLGWTFPAFQPASSDTALGGRGTLDDKGSLACLLSAWQHLLSEDFHPEGDIYFAFGHDEELGGYEGARLMAAYLHNQGVRLEWALDEGGYILENMVPGMDVPVALVGVAEKGEMTVVCKAVGPGGHSSMPGADNPVLRLSSYLTTLQPDLFPTSLGSAMEGFMSYLAPEMSGLPRLAFANPEIFRPVIMNIYKSSPEGSALIRTTVAPTVVEAGIKENAIPAEATAFVNIRILPGDSSQGVLQVLREKATPFGVTLEPAYQPVEPSPVSPSEGQAFDLLNRTVHEVFSPVAVAPYLMIAQSDGRHYYHVTDQVYRFLPFRLNGRELKGMHGADERMRAGSAAKAAWFYERLIVNRNIPPPVN